VSELPGGWDTAVVADLITGDGVFSDGDWVESKDQDPTGSIRLIQLADIGDGVFINKSNRFINEEKFEQLRCTEIVMGDVLIARMPAPLGRACMLPVLGQRCITVVDVAIVRPGRASVKPRWLMHFLNSPSVRQEIEIKSTGSTRRRISRSNLAQMELPVPPLGEQQRIADKLDTLLARAKACRERLDRVPIILKRFRQSVLTAACSGRLTTDWREVQRNGRKDWSTVKFFDFCILQRGYDLPLSQSIDGPYPIVTSAGVVAYHSEFKARGPGVVTGRSGSIGKVHYVENDFWPHNTTLFVKDFKGNYPKYVYFFLLQFDIRKFSASTAVPTLNRNNLRDINVEVPPLAEQIEIVSRLDALFKIADKIATRYKKIEAHINDFDQSILYKAFRGELVPQDPNDEPASVLLERISKQFIDAPKHIPKLRKKTATHQKELNQQRRRIMIKSRRDSDVKGKPFLTNKLKDLGGKASAEQLYDTSNLDIVDFYKQLSDEYDQGWLRKAGDIVEVS
jgi:type I restriction enzyme, S subunit